MRHQQLTYYHIQNPPSFSNPPGNHSSPVDDLSRDRPVVQNNEASTLTVSPHT